MLPQNEDKKTLIESMKKLTHHIANNTQRQRDIFNSLSKNDLNKILYNLNDENQYLRRVSGLLLCELFYNNPVVKEEFIYTLEISPNNGRICLRNIPESIQKYPSTMKKCLQLLKSPIKRQQLTKLCWAINLDRKVLQLQLFDYKKYSSFTFLDPARNLFGFTIINPQLLVKKSLSVQKNTNLNTLNSSLQNHSNFKHQRSGQESKQRTSTSRQKISQILHTHVRSIEKTTPTTCLFQNYIQSAHSKNNSRSRQKQTLNPNQKSQLSSSSKQKLSIKYYRPVQTSNNGRVLNRQRPVSHHQTISHDGEYYQKKQNTSNANSKPGNTIHSISQYARNSNRKNTTNNKINESSKVSYSHHNQSQNTDQRGNNGKTKNSILDYDSRRGYSQLQKQKQQLKHPSPNSRLQILASRKYGKQYIGSPLNKNAGVQIINQDLIPSAQLLRSIQQQKADRRYTFGISNTLSYQRKQRQKSDLRSSGYASQFTNRQKQSFLTIDNSKEIDKAVPHINRQRQYVGYQNVRKNELIKSNDLFYKKVKEILRKQAQEDESRFNLSNESTY